MFVGCALSIDTRRRGRHQWDMSMLTLIETLEVGVLPYSIIYDCFSLPLSAREYRLHRVLHRDHVCQALHPLALHENLRAGPSWWRLLGQPSPDLRQRALLFWCGCGLDLSMYPTRQDIEPETARTLH